jgi:hypothetical protein
MEAARYLPEGPVSTVVEICARKEGERHCIHDVLTRIQFDVEKAAVRAVPKRESAAQILQNS